MGNVGSATDTDLSYAAEGTEAVATCACDFLGGEVFFQQVVDFDIRCLENIDELKQTNPIAKFESEKGICLINTTDSQIFNKLFFDPKYYTICDNGYFYPTKIPITIPIFKKNIQRWYGGINVFTSIASSFIIKNKNFNNNNQNQLILNLYNKMYQKLGFTTIDFDYFNRDFYYIYFLIENNLYIDDNYKNPLLKNITLLCIQIAAIVIFSWNLIRQLAIKYNIIIKEDFYLTFYSCIFKFLNGNKIPIIAENFNLFFNKYYTNFVPNEFNQTIIKISEDIYNSTDAVKIIILKQASYVLNLDELLINYNLVFDKINYDETKIRYFECINFKRNFRTFSIK
jgi:hypothetical protein